MLQIVSREGKLCYLYQTPSCFHTNLKYKQSTIIQAQGEAQSAMLIGDAIKRSAGFLKLREIEAARDIANVWFLRGQT